MSNRRERDERLREILRLRRDERMTYEAIGDRLGVSKETVRQALASVGADGRVEIAHRKPRADRAFDPAEAVRLTQRARLTPAEIAERFGVTAPRIHAVLDEAGVKPAAAAARKPRRILSAAEKAEIVRLYADEGKTQVALAKTFDVTQPTVRYILVKAGLLT